MSAIVTRAGAGCSIHNFNLEFYVNYLYSFDPPGKMSSGMSCEFLVTFKPMVSAQWKDPSIGQ